MLGPQNAAGAAIKPSTPPPDGPRRGFSDEEAVGASGGGQQEAGEEGRLPSAHPLDEPSERVHYVHFRISLVSALFGFCQIVDVAHCALPPSSPP